MTTVTPFLMFEGNAQAAMDLYLTVFPDSRVVRAEHYPENGRIKVATFSLCGREFMCSDSPIKHNFTFTPASSIFVEFDNTDALHNAFNQLAQDGQILMPLDNYGFSMRFGWVNDRFGVSWQLNLPA